MPHAQFKMADDSEKDNSIMQFNMEGNPNYNLTLALFSEVKNSSELRQLIVKGGLEAAVINACMVADPFHVVVAGHKALHLYKQDKMKTRTLHSEIVFNLSPSNNINESFKRFGILDTTSDILVAMLTHGSPTQKFSELKNTVKGKLISLSELPAVSDKGKIKQVYGITDEELRCGSLETGVITRIATKDAT